MNASGMADFEMPHILAVPENISDDDALALLRTIKPERSFRIEHLPSGKTRLWEDATTREGKKFWLKMTVRPTLRECVGRARWFYLDYLVNGSVLCRRPPAPKE